MVEPNLVLPDIGRRDEALWSFLLFSGYLKPVNLTLAEGRWWADLEVPNREVATAYRGLFQGWLHAGLGSDETVSQLLSALLEGRRAPSACCCPAF